MVTFDYIFVRVFKIFKRNDDTVAETSAAMLLSLLQFLTIVSTIFIIQLFVYFKMPSKWYFLPVIALIGIFNWYRYERNFDIEKYEERFGAEPVSERRKKGWLIVLWFVVAILIPISIGVLRHNYGVL